MNLVIRTLSDRIFEIVREQIVSGKLAKDAPIRQDALAAELGVSKIPLREALARLEQEGLLTSQPNRGFFVRPMSTDEAVEIFELRLGIEPRAGGEAALVATPADHQAAREALVLLDNAAAQGLQDVAALNRAFHLALVRPLHRMLTISLVERLHILSERYVFAHLAPAGRESRAHEEHQLMLDAWIAADAKATSDLLSTHIARTMRDLQVELDTFTPA